MLKMLLMPEESVWKETEMAVPGVVPLRVVGWRLQIPSR